MENDRRIEISKYDGHTPPPWESTDDGIVGFTGETDVTLHLFSGCYSATDALLVADTPKILAELNRMYEREDKLLGWIERTIADAKDYVTYDEEDEMWVFDESKSSNPGLDAMDFVIDLATTDLKSV